MKINGDKNTKTNIELMSDVDVNAEVDTNIELAIDADVNIEGDTELEGESDTELEQLERDEHEVSNILCALETKHKEMVTSRRQIAESLESSKAELEKLIKLVSDHEEKVTQNSVKYNELALKMKTLNLEMNDYRELLYSIRARKEELKQIFILVSADGTIEVENNKIPFVENDEEAFEKMVMHPAAEILTVRQVRTVVRLLAIVKVYEEEQYKFEIYFESEEMKEFYEAVK